MRSIRSAGKFRLKRRSLRLRFALALSLLVAIIVANVAFLAWSGRQRGRVFEDLRVAIDRHGVLNEARAWVDAESKQVTVLRSLLDVGGGALGRDEERRILRAIAAGRDDFARPLQSTTDPAVAWVGARLDSLATALASFYADFATQPQSARAIVDSRIMPLSAELLARDLPAASRAQNSRVHLADDAFARGDRVWSRAVGLVLLLSALLFAGISWSTSRDLIAGIAALKAGADEFGAGRWEHRVEVRTFEELGEVGHRMNTMADRLQNAHEELAIRNEELALLAFRDPLTKLSNRALFRERVEQALLSAGNDDAAAVLFIDLDNFKAVNDTFGHNVGDRLLVEVADRLLHTTRGCDTVARLGGDEFGILLDADQGIDCLAIAERSVEGLRKPFTIDGRVIHVGASIGLARAMEGDTADEVLRNADVAMYAAKENGKDCYRVFAPEMHAALLDRAELEAALRAALQNGEIDLEFQPIVELASESITGYEALARWRNRLRGNVQPSVFIPLAEECGVILDIGRWVLREACREAARWEQMLPAVPITVSINVSSHQLEDPGFITELTAVLAESGLSPSRLVLEITESVIMRDSAANLERLRQLKALGIRLAIDDFGTGFSSLAYLQRFPVDVIKIDKAFVKSVAISANDEALARTIIMLSDTLRLKTVAEGIEYHDQQDTLRALGCNLGQGFLFSKPLAASQIRASLRAHARAASATGRKGGAGVHIGLVSPDFLPEPIAVPAFEPRRTRKKKR